MKINKMLMVVMCAITFIIAMPPKPGQRGPATCIVGEPLSHAKNLSQYTIETVAILVQFTDNRADTIRRRPARFDSMFYSTGVYYGQYRQGSLNDFFKENSYNETDVVGGIAANRWFLSNRTYSYYYDGNYMLSTGYQLARDAVALADATVNFAQYDLNNDGHIDGVFVVHAGPGGEDTGNVNNCWSHAIPSFNYSTNDGVVIDGATNVPEVNLVTSSLDTTLCCIAVMCHELGHVVGLPDLYDGSRNTWGIGYWGLMGYGAWGAGGNTPWSPTHCESWSKVLVNWLTFTPIVTNTFGLKILDMETHPVAYRVWRNGAINDTFFILENRQNKGFDSPMHGRGLMIWHIDRRYGSYHNIVDVEEADGCDDLDHGWGYRPDPHYYHHELGDSGDPFPGDSSTVLFNTASYPSSRDNSGNPTNVTVRNIVLLGDTVRCDVLINSVGIYENKIEQEKIIIVAEPNPFRNHVSIKLQIPKSEIESNRGCDSDARIYLGIYNIAGELVKSTSLPTTRSMLPATLQWDGRDDMDMSLPAGVYFLKSSFEGNVAIQKLVFMR